MEFSYATIKELAKQTGRRVVDLIALASQNDPFYTGTPGEVTLAEWFAEFYHNNYRLGTVVHVRRCHYKILSLSMWLPNGKRTQKPVGIRCYLRPKPLATSISSI